MKKYVTWGSLAYGFFLLIYMGSCASNLEKELTDNKPRGGLEQSLDLSLIEFVDVNTRETVNVAAYMEQNQKDYMLLTFGSKNCSSCNKKAVALQDRVIGRHPLFLTEAGEHLEIMGVNTDRLDKEGVAAYLAGLSFIRWSDPRGDNMVKYFMPEGYTFSVPLTVLVVKEGIAWRIPPDEVVSVDEIMTRVQNYIEGKSGDATAGDSDGGDDSGDGGDGDDGNLPPPIVIPDAADLASIAPGRLQRVEVRDCDGKNHKLSEILASDRGLPDMRFVQVVGGQCDQDCRDNATVMKDLAAQCEAGSRSVGGKSCLQTTLVADLTPEDCAQGNVYQGGEEFFEVFDWHFYRSTVGNFWEPQLPALTGPLTFGFAASGMLAYSHQGKLPMTSAKLASWLAGSSQKTVATGPAFPLFSREDGVFTFDQVRKGQELTILTVFDGDFVCSGCIKELRHWSAPGELVDICANTGRCRMLAMEFNQRYGSSDAELERWLDDLHNAPDPFGQPGHLLDGIRVPVVLDPVSATDRPHDRFHQGFLAGITGNTISKTVIFNREGRIVYINKPENVGDDEITPAVKRFLGLGD